MKNDESIVYLDNAATTFPKPEVVYEAMDSFYRSNGGNAGRGSNPLARRAASMVEETRALIQEWLQAPNIVFSASSTLALNTLIFGARLRTGDVIYVSPFEHNSVLRPLNQLRKLLGIEIKVLPFDKQSYQCKLNEIKRLFRFQPPTILCISEISNVLGLMLPIQELALIAKESNPECIVIVDGSQTAGIHLTDMKFVDALVWSGHKSFYGPYGVAGIAFGSNWRPEPLIYGGTGTVSESLDMPMSGASRFEAGSLNISALAGLNAGVKWLDKTGRDIVYNHTQHISRFLYYSLSEVPNCIIYAAQNYEKFFGVISFNIEGIKPQVVETALGSRNIAVRAGLHCSPWTHEWLASTGMGGTVRVSPSFFTDEEMIRTLCKAICDLQGLE